MSDRGDEEERRASRAAKYKECDDAMGRTQEYSEPYAGATLGALNLPKWPSHGELSETQYEHLASELKSNPELKELDLRRNTLNESGVELLCAALESPNCRLQTLRLRGSIMSERCCASLASALKSDPSYLRELDLSEIENLTDSGVKLLATGLGSPHCRLRTLRLADCKLSESSCGSLLSALQSNPSYLEELDLSGNSVEDSGVKLLRVLLKNPLCFLNTLTLRSCLLSDSGCIALVSALESQLPHLMEVDLSGNELQERGKRDLLGLVKHPGCRMRSLRVGDGQDLVKRDDAEWLTTIGAKRRKTSVIDETVGGAAGTIRYQHHGSNPQAGQAPPPPTGSWRRVFAASDYVEFDDPGGWTPCVHEGGSRMYGDNMQRVEHEAAWPLEKQTSIKERGSDSGSSFWSSSYGPFAGSDCVDHFSLDPNRTKPEVHSTVGQMHQINTPTLFSPEPFDEHGPSSYRFRSSSAGVFQCKLTRLVFKMTQGGELVYWIIQWDEDLLNSAGKTPAGPLFSISCSEGSVSQLHLPHCGNLPGLSVVHISNDGMSILQPLEITASHVVVDVPHLSAFGLVWDIIKRLLNIQIQICGQVLLFYRPQYKNQSQKLNVFLLPENVPLQEVKCQQKMAEYIEAPSSCLLTTGQFYSLLCPEAHMIQPECALFDLKYGPNYHPTFDIRMTPNTKEVTVRVRDQEERHVWAYRAELPDNPYYNQ